MAMFGAIAIVPQYLQIVKGATPTHSGLLMLPLMAGIMTGSLSSGQITAKTGRYKIFPLIGTLLMTGGLILFHQVAVGHPAVADRHLHGGGRPRARAAACRP